MSLIADVVARLNAVRIDLNKQRQRTLSLADQVEQATRRLTAVIGTSTNPNQPVHPSGPRPPRRRGTALA